MSSRSRVPLPCTEGGGSSGLDGATYLTWVTAELVTAALLNTHLRDNLLETAPAKAAAAGDVFYATAAHALAKLGIGAAGQRLRVNAGATAPEWAGPPTARAYHDANQSINHNTWTALALNSERWDTDAIHDKVTNNNRLTCKTAGYYLIVGHVTWDQGQTGTRVIAIYQSGAVMLAEASASDVNNGIQVPLSVATIWGLAVNESVELSVLQTNPGLGALNVLAASNYSPEFGMMLIG